MLGVYFARRRRRVSTALQRFQGLRLAAGRVLLAGIGAGALHVIAMIHFEELSLREAVWLTGTR